jgi:hypothetical protein
MNYRLWKFCYSTSAVLLFVILALVGFGYMRGFSDVWLVGISLAWLKLGATAFRGYKQAFEDRLMRRLVQIPLVVGSTVAVAGFAVSIASGGVFTSLLALVAMGCWLAVYMRLNDQSMLYDTVGSGYLAKSVWLNPPIEVIPDGALILTDGRMARRAKNSVGHSELVVRDEKGKLQVASSYIETGVVMHTLRAFIAVERKSKENYIVLVPREPLTEAQSAKLFATAEQVLQANKLWRDRENERRTWLFNKLPVPAKWRAWLFKYAMSQGYDPLGKYWGGERKDRYTCMAHNLHLLRAAGVPVGSYGTGAFGLVGEFNPLVPVRLMHDPAYRVLTVGDRAVHDAKKGPPSPCSI